MRYLISATIAIILLAGTVCSLDVQTGAHVPIKQGQGHIFEKQNTEGDSKQYEVTFPQAFSKAPNVLITVEQISQESVVPNGWEVVLDEVSASSFKYTIWRFGDQKIFAITVRWFASIDSSLQIYYYNLFIEDFDHGEAKIFWPEGEEGLPFDNVDGSVFLLGHGWSPSNIKKPIDVEIYIEDIDQYGCTLFAGALANPKETYFGDWLSIVIAVANQENFQSSGVSVDVKDPSDSWVKGGRSQRVKSFGVDLEDANYFDISNRFAVQGISAYSFKAGPSMRLITTNYVFDDTNGMYTLDLATWSDTVAYGAQVGLFFYQHVPDCATVYTECDYQGDSLQICSDTPVSDFESTQWGDKSVKSVQVPFKRTLTLYDQSGLSGPYVQLHDDVSCVDGSWTFSE